MVQRFAIWPTFLSFGGNPSLVVITPCPLFCPTPPPQVGGRLNWKQAGQFFQISSQQKTPSPSSRPCGQKHTKPPNTQPHLHQGHISRPREQPGAEVDAVAGPCDRHQLLRPHWGPRQPLRQEHGQRDAEINVTAGLSTLCGAEWWGYCLVQGIK